MHTHTITWRVPLWAYVPLGAAITAEAVSNALRAYGLGQHLENFTVSIQGQHVSLAGSVLVLAAVAISLSQARAAWVALTPNPLRQRIVAGLAAALLLAVSATAMVSHILEAQRAKVADEGGARSAYDRAEAAYKRASAELEALGNPRPVSVIQADVRNFKIDAGLWSRSKQCEDATKPDTQAYCEPILALYKERGAAARKTELEPEVSRLRTELASLNRPEAVSAEEAEIGGWWAWIMGAAVVFVATFGSVIFARATKTETQKSATRQPSATETMQTSFHADDLAATRATVLGTPHSVLPFARRNGRNRDNGRNSGNGGNPGNRPRRPKPDNPGNAGPYTGRVFSRTEAERDIVTMLASGATVASQDDLAARWSVDKGTVSRWLKHMRELGLVPAAQRVGRCHRLVAAE
jgi:hypothetical protein